MGRMGEERRSKMGLGDIVQKGFSTGEMWIGDFVAASFAVVVVAFVVAASVAVAFVVVFVGCAVAASDGIAVGSADYVAFGFVAFAD